MNHHSNPVATIPTLEDIRAVAPGLEHYTQGRLFGDLWKRPDKPARSHALRTVASSCAEGEREYPSKEPFWDEEAWN